MAAASYFSSKSSSASELCASLTTGRAGGAEATSVRSFHSDAALDAALEAALQPIGAPGGLSAVFQLDKPLRIGAYGVRKLGEAPPMQPSDLVHIGSNTKAMTAVLLARLVQQKQLQWHSTVGDVLGGIQQEIHPQFRGATLAQLLQHTAGVAPDAADWWAYPGEPLRTRRLKIARDGLSPPPLSTPGQLHAYSNLSVLVAGAMAEEATGRDWEVLMQQELFTPLGLSSAGFGVPGSTGGAEQPWGHVGGEGGGCCRCRGGGLLPVQIDNDPSLGPAGTVHLTLADWGRFLSIFLEPVDGPLADEGGGGAAAFLSTASKQQLLQPGTPGGSYGMGWILAQRSWAGGLALSHAGSNTSWYTSTWVAPGRGTAFMIAVNAYNKQVQSAANQFITVAVTQLLADVGRQGKT